MNTFEVRPQADGTTKIWEIEHQRYVSPEYYLLLEAQAAGQEIPAVPYVEPPAPPPDLRAPKRADAYTQFLLLCQALGFPTKAGFQELFAAIEALKSTNLTLGLELGIRLLAVQAMWSYYGGSWDDCPETLESSP